jgi:oligosaccharyltransferase complex subunit delta (ribophorin II)
MDHANKICRISQSNPLTKPISLGATDALKILLTTQEDNKAKRPHQAFLHVKDSESNLETSFAFQVKENGKGKVELVSLAAYEASFTS